MKAGGKKLVVMLAVILVALIILVVRFWDVLLIHLCPKVVLTESLTSAFSQLQQRFDGDPIFVLLKGLDSQGNQSVDLVLDTEDAFVGPIQYNMQVQLKPHSLMAEGDVSVQGKTLSLQMYMDETFAAVSSGELVNGSFYGITFDTFLQDIRRIPLLTWMIGDSVLQQWNTDLLKMKDLMTLDRAIPEIPEISLEDLQKLMVFVIAAPADVEKTDVVLDGQNVTCHKITYLISGAQVAEAANMLIPGCNTQNAKLQVSFYLYEKKLILMDAEVTTEQQLYRMQAELGTDIQTDPVTLELGTQEGVDAKQTRIRIFTEHQEGRYLERLEIRDKRGENHSLIYDWESDTGNMELQVDGSEKISLNLTEAEDGFHVSTDNVEQLLAAWMRQPDLAAKRHYSGTMTVKKGADFAVPAYKNLDQWSMEDFLILLEGLGSLMGIRFE